MIRFFLPLLQCCFAAFFATACTVNPFTVDRTSREGANTKIYSGGGSLFTKADYEDAIVSSPDGTKIEFRRWNKDETEVARFKANTEMATEALSTMGTPINNAVKLIR